MNAEQQAEVEASSGKRRRITPISSGNSLALRDLPNEALAYAAGYLARPSKALFSIALFGHEPAEARDNDLSQAILGLSGEQRNREQYYVLDFGEIEWQLAAKITDDILRAILLRIGALAKLKKLKLTGCTNISGEGLDPLRGSVLLEQIDLSLVAEHKSPEIYQTPLSQENILTILDTIIERDDNVLRSIVFPKRWREQQRGNTALTAFMGRCNQMFDRRNIACAECDELFEDNPHWSGEWFPLEGGNRGIQRLTCYNCTKHFCYNCNDEGLHHTGDILLDCCGTCEKSYCGECASMEKCRGCPKTFCKKCKSIEKCSDCDKSYCKRCSSIKKCGGSSWGLNCNVKVCVNCSAGECEKCWIPFCGDCHSSYSCSGCDRAYFCGNCCDSSDEEGFCYHHNM